MFKAVIFDMDGVIIDSEPIHKKVLLRLLEEFKVTVSDEEYKNFIGLTNTVIWTKIIEKYGITENVEDLVVRQVRENLKEIGERDVEPIDGIRELLESLKREKIKIGLASSSPMEGIELVLDKFRIKGYFQEVLSGEDLERPKPEPDIFLKTAKRLGVNPWECVVIEDSKNGVKAAKAADMKCIGYLNPNSGEQDISRADLIVESIEEINIKTLEGLF